MIDHVDTLSSNVAGWKILLNMSFDYLCSWENHYYKWKIVQQATFSDSKTPGFLIEANLGNPINTPLIHHFEFPMAMGIMILFSDSLIFYGPCLFWTSSNRIRIARFDQLSSKLLLPL